MTLRELKKRVDAAVLRLHHEEDDFEVVIPNNKPSMGARSMTRVSSAGQGFDWENEYFIINPEVKMQEDTK